MNKNLATNLICLALIVVGYTLTPSVIEKQVLTMGYFGFSGAITNWLAIHMLFEKVPGLYGSGIIPLKFESFKDAIRKMIMDQFFTVENIERFIKGESGIKPNLESAMAHLNYDLIFDGFMEVVTNSKFGGMLAMFGGTKALEPMREKFAESLKEKLIEITQEPDFLENLTGSDAANHHELWQGKIAEMVDTRLNELTPQMVKEIIQEMIRSHLGWLVVWGGVFGGLIGLVSSFLV